MATMQRWLHFVCLVSGHLSGHLTLPGGRVVSYCPRCGDRFGDGVEDL